jgi:sulfhydrogenase subunit beta (sulfur reductase)
MQEFTITKNKLKDFINKIKKDYTIFAPTNIDNIISYKQINDFSEINLNFCNSKVPPKSIFFKQTETLFKFKPGIKVKIESIDLPKTKNIIFGIRPCDAKSLSILDNVFKEDYFDPYFVTKRENTILIGLSCIQPDKNCFCTSFEINPTGADNVDVLFTDIGDKYFIEINSNKGSELVKNTKNLFSIATIEDRKRKQEVEKKSKNAIKRIMKTEDIANKLDTIFENEIWKNISLKCLGCGICTFQCPTCHCFDIQDETTLKDGARVRVWDTCMNSEYTVQASGYNPRPARMNRTRNRVYHKFNYYPKNYNVIACVGCGRCINDCPVNIDIIDVINQTGGVKK